jgi:hypothetical protein
MFVFPLFLIRHAIQCNVIACGIHIATGCNHGNGFFIDTDLVVPNNAKPTPRPGDYTKP